MSNAGELVKFDRGAAPLCFFSGCYLYSGRTRGGMTIVVRNTISELDRVGKLVSEFWTQHGLPPELENDVHLSLEEIVANVIMHGYPDGVSHEFLVRLRLEDGLLTVEVEDDGVAFNPLDAPEPDVRRPLADRRIGGLGIHLVRHFMDSLEYRREAAKNYFVMRKRVRA